MSECKYLFRNDSREYTYEELVREVKYFAASHDLLFSKDYSKLKRTVEKLKELKEIGKIKFRETTSDRVDLLNGCAELSTGNKEITLQGLIDSSIYRDLDGNPYMTPLVLEDFLTRLKLLYQNAGMNEEDIQKHLLILKNSWKRIAEDGRDFHRIILGIHGSKTAYADVELATRNTSFHRLTDKIYNLTEGDIFKEVKLKNSKNSKELNDDSLIELIKNINLKGRVLGTDLTLLGHIDYLLVRPDGSLEIFNIKSSHEPHALWDKAKKDKYRHEFALIAQLLQNNGISVKNIRFNIVPAILEYDKDYLNVEDITILPAVCYSHHNGAYTMLDVMTKADRFLESTVEESLEISDEALDAVNDELAEGFPELNIRADGIESSIDEFIELNWKYWVRGPQPDTGYRLLIDGKIVELLDSGVKTKNKQLKKYIKENLEKLMSTNIGSLSASSLISEFKNFRRSTGFSTFDNLYLDRCFLPYFEHTPYTVNDHTEYKYKWDIIENETLENANILAFKNRDTHQLNLIVLSGTNVEGTRKFNGNSNLLGFHISDSRAVDNLGHELLKATYGNIETMRALFLLNKVIPLLDGVKLGDITVIGGLGTNIKSQSLPMELTLSNFIKFQLEINKSNPSLKMENNFKNAKFISPVEVLLQEYYNIMEESPNMFLRKTDLAALKNIVEGNNPDKLQHLINGLTIDSLASADSVEVQILRLREMIRTLSDLLKKAHISLAPDSLIKVSRSSNNTYTRSCAKLLIDASMVLNRLSGTISIHSGELSTYDKYFARPQNIANSLVRIVGKLVLDAIHNTSLRLDPEVSKFNLLCLEYYKAKGYTAAQNALIGDLVKVFKHLFVDNESELFLKNPYNPTEPGLDDMDRKFLKEVLFIFNKVRYKDTGFPYKNADDPLLIKFINLNSDNYFLAPLERASKASRWLNPAEYASDFGRRAARYVHNPKLLFKELYEEVLSEELAQQINLDIEDMQSYNPFKISNKKNNHRNWLLQNYGSSYFETNLQNLVIDYLHRDIQELEMNNMLIKVRGILLYLKLSGDASNDTTKYDEIIKYIDDYLKVSVYNKSIMNDDMLALIGRILPIRKLVTKFYIAASPVAAMRDIIGGFMSNNVRALTNFRTDMNVSDVMWAYQFVMRQGIHNAMDIDLLDKINSKYLISNVDVNRPLEAYKTNRGGIRNYDNWLFATLRKPDFFNRMVAFMAQLHHDGAEKAYYIDKETHELKYNWRMDKRFNLLSTDDKSDLEAYNKLKSLYLSLLLKFNEENPGSNLKISLSTDLPDGYTLNQIETIKNFADTIYGSYNTTTKSKYEHMALGSQFGIFSTWMNGIYDVYFGKRRESSYETKKVLKEDVNGNKLWIAEDGTITTENTGVAYLTDVPVIVQGVTKTIIDTFLALIHRNFKSEILGNSMLVRNWLRVLSDAIVWGLFKFILLEGFENEKYKEHLKKTDKSDYFFNGCCELFHKALNSSSEEFRGPFPIIDYVTTKANPTNYMWSQRTVSDLWDILVGNKTPTDVIMSALALPRCFLDTYKLAMKL